MRIKTPFKHKLGDVVISNGIGGDLFYVFAVKKNGCLKRILPQIKGSKKLQEIVSQVFGYKGKTIWKGE